MEDNQDEVEDEYYSDDPVVDAKIDWYYKLRSFAPVAILLLVTTIYLPNTVGGKISLNSNASSIEFGQAVPRTVVCTEDSSLTLTPYNKFVNSSGIGSNLFGSFKVEGIPPSCLGKDITLAAFNNTSSFPLTLFDSDTVAAIVAKVYISPDNNFYPVNSPNFQVVKNSDTSFTAVFDDPVGLSTNVAKITLQTSMHSSAGLIWDYRSTSAVGSSLNFMDVAYGNGVFLAGGMNNCSAIATMSSSDAINWTKKTSTFFDTLTFGNDKFVGGCEFLKLVYSLNSGSNWAQATTGAWPVFTGSTFGKGVYLLTGSGNSAMNIWRSTNATTWVGVNVKLSLDQVVYGNGIFAVLNWCGMGSISTAYSCGYAGQVALMTSSDLGLTWTQRTVANTHRWTKIAYGNGQFVAVSEAYPFAVAAETKKRVMTSPDGITWTSRTIPDEAILNVWSDITYGNGLFVAISNSGTGNRVMTSPDGITWTVRKAAVDNKWGAITFGNGKFVAVSADGNGNQVMSSG